MRLHRFFVPEPVGSRSELIIRSNELVHQLRRVFRIKIGEDVIIFDGSGSDYIAAVSRFDGAECVVLDVRESLRSRYMPSRKIWLFAAVVKKDNFELIVEKATELGVTDIVPVIAERSEKKAVNHDRLVKISIEASEQSGRGDVPKMHPIIEFRELFEEIRNSKSEIRSKFEMQDEASKAATVVFHTEGERYDDGEFSKDSAIALFIGPEGGWSEDELGLFHKNDMPVRSLGPHVLRAETAVVAALSMVVFGN